MEIQTDTSDTIESVGVPVFERCDFILGKGNNSIVIVVPGELPRHDGLTLRLEGDNIVFCSGDESFASVEVLRRDIIDRLAEHSQVGLIETPDGKPSFPTYITAVANIKKDENLNKEIQ